MANYLPGQEPENIKKRLNTLFGKLDEAYPDKIVVGLHSDHKQWGKTVTKLYRLLGYGSGADFLAAYGYTMRAKEGGSGRPSSTNADEIIAELMRRYPNGSGFSSAADLFAANPDLAGKMKTISNKSKELFGMPLVKYLKSIGLISEKISVQTNYHDEVIEELKQRYPNGSGFFQVSDLVAANQDLKRKIAFISKTELIEMGILLQETKEAKEQIKKKKQEELMASSGYSCESGLFLENDYNEMRERRFSEYEEKIDEIVKQLIGRVKRRKAQNLPETIFELAELYPELDILESIHWIFEVFRRSPKGFYIEKGIIRNPEANRIRVLEKAISKVEKNYGRKCSENIPRYPLDRYIEELGMDPDYYLRKKGILQQIKYPKVAVQNRVKDSVIVDYAFAGTSIKKYEVLEGITSIGSAAFANCKKLTEIVIADSVTSISEDAFLGCESLRKIRLPNGLKELKKGVFCGCTSLQNIELPSSLEVIGNMAFYECESLADVEIPEKVVSIGEYAFSGCKCLEALFIPDTVEKLSTGVVSNCASLRRIRIPKVKDIEWRVFSNMPLLERLDISFVTPESRTMPDDQCAGISGIHSIVYSFEDCPNVAISTIIPISKWKDDANVLYPGGGLWREELKESVLRGISLDLLEGKKYSDSLMAENKKYLTRQRKKFLDMMCADEGILRYALGQGILNFELAIELRKKLEKSESLTRLIDGYINANFSKESQKKKLERQKNINPNVISTIRDLWNFDKKSDGTICLKSYKGAETDVLVPEKIGDSIVSEISYECFSPYQAGAREQYRINREKIETIVIPETVTAMGNNMFYGCSSLRRVVLPSRLKTIPQYFFLECKKLEDVNIPEGITSVGERAFGDCKNLKRLDLPDGITSFQLNSIKGCSSLEELVLPACINKVGPATFSGLSNLKRIIFSNDIEMIEYHAFKGCSKLRRIVLPSIQRLGKNVFLGCSNSVRIIYFDFEWPDQYTKPFVIDGFSNEVLDGKTVSKEDLEEIKEFIRQHPKSLYRSAIKRERMMKFMLDERMIPLCDINRLIDMAEEVTSIRMMLLEYQQNNTDEEQRVKMFEERFSL